MMYLKLICNLLKTTIYRWKNSAILYIVTALLIYSCNCKCVHEKIHHDIDVTFDGARGGRKGVGGGEEGYGIFREHKNRTRTSCHHKIYDLYVRVSRMLFRTRLRVYTRASVRYPRLPKLQRCSRRKRGLLFPSSSSFSSSSSIRPLFKRNRAKRRDLHTYYVSHTRSALISPATAGN